MAVAPDYGNGLLLRSPGAAFRTPTPAPGGAFRVATPAALAGSATQQAAAPSLAISPTTATGGSGAVSAATTAAAAPSLSDYINSNFLYQQQQGVNDNALANYDASTLKGQQDTQAEQALRNQQLTTSLNDAGTTNAEDLAAHGLLRSGVDFQNQDKIDAQGVTQKSAIDSLLTNFLSQRDTGRLTQQQANQQALNSVMNQLATQFNTQNQATV
jgi:hypothetical protein